MYDDPYDLDRRESRFVSQLPSVLVAVAAITLIVLVNSGVYPRAVEPAAPADAVRSVVPAIEAVQPDAKPGARTAAAAAPVVSAGSGRA